jgi:hypothetical protein
MVRMVCEGRAETLRFCPVRVLTVRFQTDESVVEEVEEEEESDEEEDEEDEEEEESDEDEEEEREETG